MSIRRTGRQAGVSNFPQPGESRKLSWEIQAVNAGHFAAYVVVVPLAARSAAMRAW